MRDSYSRNSRAPVDGQEYAGGLRPQRLPMTLPRSRSWRFPRSRIVLGVLPYVLVIILPIVQLARHFRDLQVYPFADEWLYVTATGTHNSAPWRWLWEQHGDHRIPLQKAVQWTLINASDFDYRSLVILNLIVAAAIAFIALRTARNLRGRTSTWDAFIPILLFNPMAGYALWGFHLQFLSSAFFTCVFAWALLRPSLAPWHLPMAFVAVTACSLCGLNGLLQAGLMLPLIWLRAVATERRTMLHAALAFASLMLACLWLSWSRTGAAEAGPSLAASSQFFAGLLGASLLPPREGHEAAMVVSLLAVVAVLGGLYGRPRRDEDRIGTVASLLTASVLFQLAAVAWGRAQYQGGWQPTLAMHYGAISMLLPILAWLTLASRDPPIAAPVVGIAFTFIFSLGWVNAEVWRAAYTREQTSVKARAYREIKQEDLPVSSVIEHNAARFWSDAPSAKETMARGIPILRKSYQRKWPDSAHAQPGHQDGQSPDASPLRR